MRIDTATLNKIRGAISPLDTAETRRRYLAGDFPRASAVRDLNKRYRWDLYHAAGGWRLLPEDADLDDAHIDTALRRIVPSLSGGE